MNRVVLIAGAVLGAALATGCGKAGPESFPGAPVVLVSVDTLRSDHLPAYGYRGIETPALDGLRREAILFEHAYSHYPLTFPSHCTILTGVLPSRTGVRDNVGYRLDTASLPYLPKELRAAGYATGAAVSAFVLQGGNGLSDFFDFYDDTIEVRKETPLGGLQRPGMDTLKVALRWVDQVAGRPFFLFFHIYEPHTPYRPPEPYASRYAASPYDGEIAYADAILGHLFDELKGRKLYEGAIVVVLSDHGEGLGDHGEEEHGIFLYREALQVPLLLKLPGGRHGGAEVASPAGLVDVAPTILSLVGRPIPAAVQGRPLLALLDHPADRPIYAETFYPRLHMGWSDLASLIQEGYHYIEGPDPELYRLAADPGERDNVLAAERRLFAGLRDAIRPFRTPLASPGAVDPETVARLAALGYAGTAVAAGEGPLPDPKARIGSLAGLKVASAAMGQGRWADAIPPLERLVRENPHLQDGWEKLALCLSKAGRRNDALAAYKRALENSGGAPTVALSLASLYAELGSYDEARTHAELALATMPALAHDRLAEIALAAGDLAVAERQAQAAVAAEPGKPGHLTLLAQVLSRRGKLDEAKASLAKAEELLAGSGLNPPPGFHLVRGDLLARLGQAAEAGREFREEIRRNPEVFDAYARLAALLVSEGQPQAAWRTLQEMVENNGGAPGAYAVAVETLRVLGDPATAGQLLRHAQRLYPADPQLQGLGAG
jgi:tetratricopeptide (TPR) repeat protein